MRLSCVHSFAHRVPAIAVFNTTLKACTAAADRRSVCSRPALGAQHPKRSTQKAGWAQRAAALGNVSFFGNDQPTTRHPLLQIDRALKYKHFGEITDGVDERAEVGVWPKQLC